MASSRKTAVNESVATYGTGRDYSALATWEAATDLDMVATTTSYVLECYDDEISFDDYVVLAGAVDDTNASYFRIIRPASGQGHDGTPNNGFTIDCTIAVAIFNNPSEAYSQFQDIIVTASINDAANVIGFIIGDGSASANGAGVIGCIVFDLINDGAGTARGFIGWIPGGVGNVVDCLAHNCDEYGFQIASSDINLYNNDSTFNGYGFYNSSASVSRVAKNCCASGNTTADWIDSGGGWTKITCTAEGANPTYVNAGGDDFHLAVGDTVCRGNGTDLSGDATYPFDDDIDETTRSAWDVGFDEYEAAGLSIPIVQYYHNQARV